MTDVYWRIVHRETTCLKKLTSSHLGRRLAQYMKPVDPSGMQQPPMPAQCHVLSASPHTTHSAASSSIQTHSHMSLCTCVCDASWCAPGWQTVPGSSWCRPNVAWGAVGRGRGRAAPGRCYRPLPTTWAAACNRPTATCGSCSFQRAGPHSRSHLAAHPLIGRDWSVVSAPGHACHVVPECLFTPDRHVARP